jgi:hypothetical protein
MLREQRGERHTAWVLGPVNRCLSMEASRSLELFAVWVDGRVATRRGVWGPVNGGPEGCGVGLEGLSEGGALRNARPRKARGLGEAGEGEARGGPSQRGAPRGAPHASGWQG